jgi:hypothetical protein
MLTGDNLTWLGHELGAELAAPGAVFEALPGPGRPLDRRNVSPGFVVAWPVAAMHGIEDPELSLPRCIQNFEHVRNAIVRFSHGLNAWPDLATFRDEIIVRVDHQKACDCSVIGNIGHEHSSDLVPIQFTRIQGVGA